MLIIKKGKKNTMKYKQIPIRLESDNTQHGQGYGAT